MIIEGKILQIMETWPLQLIIEETKNKYKIYVTLREDTNIRHNNNKISLNELIPNIYVRINGEYEEDKLAMTANFIEIITML